MSLFRTFTPPVPVGVCAQRPVATTIMVVGRIGAIVTFAAVTLLGGGCASVTKGTTQAITIASIPSGAAVWLDDKMIGYTPVTAAVRRKSDHLVTIEEEGYVIENVAVIRKLNAAVAGNILFGAAGLIGWGIDAASGAQYNLSPAAIRVTLKVNPAGLPTAPVAQSSAAQFIEELRKLDALHAAKTITDEEYLKMRQARVDQYSKN